jgi:hypothetical protein
MALRPTVPHPTPAEPDLVLPTAVDLRPALRAWGLEARPQGARPTCSVFAVAGALEFALAARGRVESRLSVEFLNWAAHRATGRTADGGFFSEIWAGYREYGICAEEELAYREQHDPDFDPGDELRAAAQRLALPDLRLAWIKEWDVTTGLADEQLAGSRRALAGGRPVCAGMRWPKEVIWDDGVLRMRLPEEVFDGHSVLLIGYQDNPARPGGGLFIARDSARDAGDRLLAYEYVMAYTNDAAWIG